VRIELKRPFSDGTLAIDIDPLSLLCRLAAAAAPEAVRYQVRGCACCRLQNFARSSCHRFRSKTGHRMGLKTRTHTVAKSQSSP
jgi:hypothetical protein